MKRGTDTNGKTVKQVMEELAAPFHPDTIKYRVGAFGKDPRFKKIRNAAEAAEARKAGVVILSYVDARIVQDRLDEVVGMDNWCVSYTDVVTPKHTKTMCQLSLRIDGEWITKEDGAGDSKVEAEKGSISSAFKRAAVCFGVGRYLYNDEETPEEVYNNAEDVKVMEIYNEKFAHLTTKEELTKWVEDNKEALNKDPDLLLIRKAYAKRLNEV